MALLITQSETLCPRDRCSDRKDRNRCKSHSVHVNLATATPNEANDNAATRSERAGTASERADCLPGWVTAFGYSGIHGRPLAEQLPDPNDHVTAIVDELIDVWSELSDGRRQEEPRLDPEQRKASATMLEDCSLKPVSSIPPASMTW